VSKIPDSPQEIFEEFVSDYQRAFGKDLQAVILYGSGAKGEYVAGRSDINFLVILSRTGIDGLDKALDLIPKWQKRNVAVPLVLTKAYIASAQDTFPIEFLDMHAFHEVVFGEDVLADVQIKKEDLRLQVERELRGKLIQLRTGFLQSGNDREQLKGMLAASVATFLSIFSGLLYLKGAELPQKRQAIFEKTSETFGLQTALFLQVLAVKDGKWQGSRRQLQDMALSYIGEVRKLVEIVDQLSIG